MECAVDADEFSAVIKMTLNGSQAEVYFMIFDLFRDTKLTYVLLKRDFQITDMQLNS